MSGYYATHGHGQADNQNSQGDQAKPGDQGGDQSKTPPKPAGIPDNWIERPTDKNGGTEWVNPDNPNDRARVMPGNPDSPYPHQQGPYVSIKMADTAT
jgi:hypothetical protein